VLGELLERTPAAFRKLLILEKITNFEEKAPFLATRQVYRGSANSAGNCGDMYRKVKADSTRKRPKGELNHHNKGAEDEERVQLPSLRRRTTVSVA
jgi:hypothetical protein